MWGWLRRWLPRAVDERPASDQRDGEPDTHCGKGHTRRTLRRRAAGGIEAMTAARAPFVRENAMIG